MLFCAHESMMIEQAVNDAVASQKISRSEAMEKAWAPVVADYKRHHPPEEVDDG